MKLFRVVAVILAIYTLIEITDCLTLLLMHFGVLQNPYPVMSFQEFETLINNQPFLLFPVFLYL